MLNCKKGLNPQGLRSTQMSFCSAKKLEQMAKF